MAPPIWLGFNFSFRATHPMSQGIRSKQYHSCIHSCKDSSLRIKAAMNIMNEYIETKVKVKMPQRWKDQYMSTWGSVAPSCRDVYFNYLIFVRSTQSSLQFGPNIHPHSILEGLGNLPRRDIYTYVRSTDASYHIVSTTVKKTLSRQHLYMILSLDSNSGCAMTD